MLPDIKNTKFRSPSLDQGFVNIKIKRRLANDSQNILLKNKKNMFLLNKDPAKVQNVRHNLSVQPLSRLNNF